MFLPYICDPGNENTRRRSQLAFQLNDIKCYKI